MATSEEKKLYPVRLLKPYKNLNKGEVAGFTKATVERLIKADAAVRVDPKAKDPKAAEQK